MKRKQILESCVNAVVGKCCGSGFVWTEEDENLIEKVSHELSLNNAV